MALNKDPKADLRRMYKKVFEVSLVISLLLLIVAFKYFPDMGKSQIVLDGPQELFTVEDIEIASTEIDINAQIDAPPPPKEEKKVEEEPTYFVAVEEMPEPIGGIQAIQSKIIYPEIAKRAGVEGKVYVLAFVNETGEVTNAKILKGLGAGLDEAALNAVKQTKFKPGKQRGKPVKVQVSIPIVFKLQ